MMTSKHDKATTLMNSPQLWPPEKTTAQDRARQNSSMDGAGAGAIPLLGEGLLAVDGSQKQNNIFLWGCDY